MRSPACSLVANGATDEEIRAAITDALRDDLAIALEGALTEQASAHPAAISAAVGGVVGLVGMAWSQRIRDEFTDLALGEFCRLPGAMVIDALTRARHRVNDGRFLVSWVFEDVAPKASKLEREVADLTRLANLAVPAE